MLTHRLKILIIEDDDVDRMRISRYLNSTGFPLDLAFAFEPEEAMEQVIHSSFDCIFLDYNLPGANGLEVLEKIRSHNKSCQIIIMTSHGDLTNAVKAMQSGANDYLTKDQINSEGAAQKLISIHQNLENQRKQNELKSQLRETQKRLETVIANSPIIVFALDSNGLFTLFDGKGTKPFNFQNQEIIGKHISTLDEIVPDARQLFEKGMQGESENVVVEAGVHFFEIFYSPMRSQSGTIMGVTGVATDVTQLTKAKQMAEEAAAMKQNFIANMSHEIRTPMNGIFNLTNILLRTTPSEEQFRYLELIRKSTMNLMVIINDILDFSKIDSGKMTFESIPFHPSEIILLTEELFRAKATEKGITLSMEIDPLVPETVSGDPTRLSQVLNNLVSNAIKFTDEGDVRIKAMVKSLDHDSVRLCFEIRDTGIGIPASSIEQIFERFQQASTDTHRKYGGTGLGLSIVKLLVEMQGGQVLVRSQPGKGSRFLVELDFGIVQENIGGQVPENSDDSHVLSGVRVLLAEDHPVNQLIAKKFLSDWGAQIECANNGAEAIRLLEQQSFDIILMDIQMPEMDGHTATRLIRKHSSAAIRELPIVAMTAHVIDSERQMSFENGMNEYIRKPFDPETLKNVVYTLTRKQPEAYTQSPLAPASEQNDMISPNIPNSGKNQVLNRRFQPKTPDWIQGNPPKINLTYLKQISDGNDAFIIEMIEMFLNKTPQALEEMEAHFRQQNWEELRHIAHRIKPSFVYIGLPDLQKTLAEIEQLTNGIPDRPMVIQELIQQVKKTSDSVFDQLRGELDTLR